LSEWQSQNALARVEYDVDGPITSWTRKANRLAHATLDSIPLDGSAQHLAYGQSDSRFSCERGLAPQVEDGHVSRDLPASCLIYALEISMFQQTP
jgi:hypothetical protein